MKQIFKKNYRTLIILVILILAAGCLMLTVFNSLQVSEKISATTLNAAETKKLSEEEINAAKAFLEAVENLPDAHNLNYGDRSLIEDAKKKLNALSEKTKLYEGISEAEKTYNIVRDEFNSKFMIIESLVTLGKGLLGIFLVMGIIIAIIYLLGSAGKRKKGMIEKTEP